MSQQAKRFTLSVGTLTNYNVPRSRVTFGYFRLCSGPDRSTRLQAVDASLLLSAVQCVGSETRVIKNKQWCQCNKWGSENRKYKGRASL
jgi:hypothetical protein